MTTSSGRCEQGGKFRPAVPAVARSGMAETVCDDGRRNTSSMTSHPTPPLLTQRPSPTTHTPACPPPEHAGHSGLLLDFLREDRRALLQRFANLSPHSVLRGAGHRRFVYVPGTRRDRVLLVAHADTVWEHERIHPLRMCLIGNEIHSARADAGIGADDRAGCAMLWELRDSGHSLLVTSGEEIGCVAARWLMENPRLASLGEEINATHRFAVEFDLGGHAMFKCYQVGTPEFRAYCAAQTGFTDAGTRSSTDIGVLCRTLCGVNLSVGYYESHTEEEFMRIDDWSHTLRSARKWLSSRGLPAFARTPAPSDRQKRFGISF